MQSQVEPNFHLKQEIQGLKRKLSVDEKGTDNAHISRVLESQAHINKIERENLSLLNQVKELTEVISKFKSENENLKSETVSFIYLFEPIPEECLK